MSESDAGEAVHRTLHPYGATLHVSATDPALLGSLDHAVAFMPVDAGAAGHYELHITTHDDRAGDPAWPAVSIDDRPETLEVRCGSGTLMVDHAAASAVVDVPVSMAVVDDAVRCLVEGALSSLLIADRRLHAVHSGLVVAPNGVGLALRGESGAGKSTLTYACLRAGFDVASDDWVYGVPGGPEGTLHGYPWRLFLLPDTQRFFPELADVAAVPHPSVDRWKLPIEPPRERQQASAHVDAIVLVSRDPFPGVRAVEAADAAERWWAAALPTERVNLPGAWVAGLLARPCFEIGRGQDPAVSADALARLAEQLRPFSG